MNDDEELYDDEYWLDLRRPAMLHNTALSRDTAYRYLFSPEDGWYHVLKRCVCGRSLGDWYIRSPDAIDETGLPDWRCPECPKADTPTKKRERSGAKAIERRRARVDAGRLLKTLRENAGLSQQDLAARLGVPKHAIADREAGRSLADDEFLALVQDVIDGREP